MMISARGLLSGIETGSRQAILLRTVTARTYSQIDLQDNLVFQFHTANGESECCVCAHDHQSKKLPNPVRNCAKKLTKETDFGCTLCADSGHERPGIHQSQDRLATRFLRSCEPFRSWSLPGTSIHNTQELTRSGVLNAQQKGCKVHITKANNLAVYATRPVRCYSTSHRQAYLPEPSIARMVATPTLSQSRSNSIPQQCRKSSSIPILQREKWILATTNATLFIGMKMMSTLGTEKTAMFCNTGKNTLNKKQAMFQTPGESCRHYSTGRDTVKKKQAMFQAPAESCRHYSTVRDTVNKKLAMFQTPAESCRHYSTERDTVNKKLAMFQAPGESCRHYSTGRDTVKKKLAMFQTPGESCRHYSTGRDTVEKKLLQLMDMWEVEKAVALLRESVEEGVLPHPNVVLNLQQQLANLGEVECLLNVHDFLKEHNLVTDDKFFHYLNQAYYNSGRISEGVSVLRLLYHRTRKFADVDIYFTLLTVMVLRHFPDRIDLILSFVTDLKDAEKPVLEPEASLWKCYMMMEKWTEADNLLLHNEELRPLLPLQVTRVCQDVDKTDFNKAAVLSQMLDLPFIRQKLRVLVAETLMTELCNQKQWLRLLKSLKRIKSQGLPLHVDKLASALDDLKRNLTPQYDDQVDDLRQWCEILQAGGKQ